MNKKFTVDRSRWVNGSNCQYYYSIGKKYGTGTKEFPGYVKDDSKFNIGNYSALLNEKGNMCCLGFATEQLCNVPKEKLLDVGMPNSDDVCGSEGYKFFPDVENYFTKEEMSKLIGWDYSSFDNQYTNRYPDNDEFHARFYDRAVEINDDTSITNDERESKLTELFKKFKIDVEFVGEYNA